MQTPLPGTVPTRQLLRELQKYGRLHVLLLLSVFACSAYIVRFRLLKFSSSTTVVVIDGLKSDNRNADRGLPDFLLSSDQFNRIHQVVYSNGMYDHLIGRFGLYRQYGIDSTAPDAYERAVTELRESIDLKKTPYNAAVITVNDRDRSVASAMADEIASFADSLNRSWLMRIQEKRVATYRAALDQLSSLLDNRQLQLKEAALGLSSRQAHLGAVPSQDLERAVNSLTATIENFRNEAAQSVFILQTLRNENLPTLWQQQRALHDNSSLLLPTLLWSVGITALLFLLLIVFHFYRLLYGNRNIREGVAS